MAKRKQHHVIGILTLALLLITLPLLVLESNLSQEIRQRASSSLTLPDPLFSDSSPWNQPIGTDVQLDPNSGKMVKDAASRVNATTQAFGMPLYISSGSDPLCHIKDNGNDQPFDSMQPIHIPVNAVPSTGDDHWLFIYDTTKNLIFEMWNTKRNGNCWQTDTGNVYSSTGDGVLQPNGQVQDGNGASYFGGVVNSNDAKRGYINHALSLASEHTVKNQGRYPMNHQTDGETGSGHDIPMGARFQLDPSVDCDGLSGASKGEIMICHAMQTYGGYMHDTGGVPMSIYFQEDKSAGGVWSAMGLTENNALSHIPWNKMRVLKAWNSYTQLTPTQPTSTGSPIPTKAPTPTPTVHPGKSTVSFVISVCPHGLGDCGDSINPNGGNSNPIHKKREITFTLFDGKKKETAKQVVVVYSAQSKNFQGKISLSDLENDTYTVSLKMDGFLKKQIPGAITISHNQVVILPVVGLVNGDINNDNQLTILDYNILMSCFGQKLQSSSCLKRPTASLAGSDIDDDGIVNGFDYNLFLREFIKQ